MTNRSINVSATLSLMVLGTCTAQAQSTASPFTSAARYDAAGRVTGTIAPDPDGAGGNGHPAIRNTYDAASRLIKVETGVLADWQSEAVAPALWPGFSVSVWHEIVYDTYGRKIREQTGKGGSSTIRTVTQFSYDSMGRLECTTLRMNLAAFGTLPASACVLGASGAAGPDRITRNFYDAAGQLLKVQKAVGTDVQIDEAAYTYTPNGRKEYVTDARGYRARFTYDGHDRLFQWNFPDPNAAGVTSANDYEAYQYDANGNRTYLRKRDGRVINFSYDALNRVTSKTYQHGGARPVYYAYDMRGLQTIARFDSLSGQGITNVYDGFGRLTGTTAVMSLGATEVVRHLNHAYDANGNRTRFWWPDGQYIDAAWDGLDRFDASDMSANVRLNKVQYDTEGRIIALQRWGAGASRAATSYGYNGMSQLVHLGHSFQNSGANVETTLHYNLANQIVTRVSNNNDYRFSGYVGIDRSYARNGLNQYTSAGGATFSYDANGNLTSDGTTSYTYDIENRLVSTSTGVTLSYDPLGRLAQLSTSAGATTQFLYDGDALVAEYDGTGAMTRRYVHGPAAGQDDPLVEYIGSSVASPRHLIADHQGSITAIADISGNRIAVNGYDEYGIPNGFAGSGTPNTGRFQYTGQAWIPELGMYHYKARIYSPTLGRFLQTDPIGYDDQINLYAYAGNDPVNMNDFNGQESGCITLRTGCGVKDRSEDIVNVLRGVASYPRDIAVSVRHLVATSGLSGVEQHNRAKAVEAAASRAFSYVRSNPRDAANRLMPLLSGKKAFIVGRVGAGAATAKGGGPLFGAGMTTMATVGGGIRTISNVVAQMEAGGLDSSSLSASTLGTIAAAGVLGGNAKFDAKTGDVSVTMQTSDSSSRLTRTESHVICNVNSDKGC